MRRTHFFLLGLVIPFLTACSGPTSTGGNPHNVTVSVSPSSITLDTFVQHTFTATVQGTSNTAVTWQVNSVNGGSVKTGTISVAGVYSAPHLISRSIMPADPNLPVTVTITAISQANPAATGTSTITLMPQGQAAQNGAVELGTSGSNIHASTQNGNTITCCGGTLGALVARNGTNYILSNNHVMANSDAGSIGDGITQPGLIDTGTCTSTGATTVANLSQFFTLENNPPNPVDAAIAQIVAGKVDTSGNILLLGASADANGVPVAGAPAAGSGVAASVGMAVAKSGRTTGLTCSTVDAIGVTVTNVQYFKTCGGSVSFTTSFTNQVSVAGGDFSNEGDSGSLIVTQNTADPVALLFAGSDTNTVGNPIGDVLNAFATNNGVATVVGGGQHQVIGCSLPGPSSAQKTLSSAIVSKEAMQIAVAARDSHAQELLALPGVNGIGVGASLDHAGEPAVLLFIAPGTQRSALPQLVDGVRTRIVETANESAKGILNEEDAKTLAPPQATFAVSSLSAAEIARAKAVHKAHVDEWMKQPGVQGFGITSSADSPGEAALMIFLIRGVAHNPIPPVIDGVRTRVRESSRFSTGRGGSRPSRGCSLPPVKSGQADAMQIGPAKPAQ